MQLWAKLDKSQEHRHALLYHLIDVAQTGIALWENLGESLQNHISSLLNLDPQSAGRLIAFWLGLHDLGKASPAFQRKHLPSITILEEAGLSFPRTSSPSSASHATISAWALERLLPSETHLPPRFAKKLARALGGHHGIWPTPSQLEIPDLKSTDTGDESWGAVRKELLFALQSTIEPPDWQGVQLSQEEENALLTLLSGLTSVADWIGSMEDSFPYIKETLDAEEYAHRAAHQAHAALHRLGWLSWQARGETIPFAQMFFFDHPNEVQLQVIEQSQLIKPPALVILEAPTGIGKTEAALFLADTWLQQERGRGLYLAMPTMATSNQMFTRVMRFLQNRYPEDLINLHLVHGQARWSKEMQEIHLEAVGEDEHGAIAALTWFLPRKRSLLAPFAVGTVDQALMSVMQTKHFFVRLFGLSHKVVIFDEVHAYDTYMSSLFQRLLSWLSQIGSSVIILSATLPDCTRRELIIAYQGKDQTPSQAMDASYPRLTWANKETVNTLPLPSPPSRRIELQWIFREPEAILAHLTELLKDGGCAVVICNTVSRAQAIYRALKDAHLVPEQDLLLFHARYPFAWRDGIERNVLERFGKDGQRPQRSILVATQVVEQSLDLDFDLMLSDLAPVDLLLQRAGRLHRHSRNRPNKLRHPHLLLTRPKLVEDLPNFESDRYVYEEYFLLATYGLLIGRSQIELPSDTKSLIEGVYGDGALTRMQDAKLQQALSVARNKMERNRNDAILEAKSRLVRPPQAEDLLSQANLGLEEENPDIHRTFQAMTRLIDPGVSLICLHQTEKGLALEPDGCGAPLDLTDKPSPQVIPPLLQRAIEVRHAAIVHHLLGQDPPKAWERVAALRHHRLAIFENGLCRLEGIPYTLHLSRETGLEIQKEAE